MLEQGLEIAKTNWKHNLRRHFWLAAALCLLAPAVMGVKNLDEMQVARIVDMYLGFFGIVLIIPVFLPDADRDIRDLTASKRMPVTGVRIIRLFEALLAVVFFLLLFLWMLKSGGCRFSFGRCFYAAFANTVMLGGLGLFFYGLTDNLIIAYMMPLIYYVTSLGAGKKYLDVFWLLGFAGSGEALSVSEKVYLLAAGGIMMVLSLGVRWWRRT